MADYERSPKSSHRAYKPHRNRTSDWVSRLPPKHAAQFLDPTMPPSDTESAIYTSDSDGESTRSVPPRFVLRFPDGREERVSEGYYSHQNASSRSVRSRAASGPVNTYGQPPHHHPRSMSVHQPGGHPRVSAPLFRPHSSNTNTRPQEQIRVLPPQRSMTPGTAGYVNSRPVQVHSRPSPVLAPSPRRAYNRDSDASYHGAPDDFVKKHGPPEAIAYSYSHPPSKYDPPTRDYSARSHRPHPSTKHSRQSVVGSPFSHTTQLTKENTIANSRSHILSRGVVDDNWSVIDEDELEWEREQQRKAHQRGRTSSQSSGSPPLTYSRSRTTSSSSRSGYHPPGPKLSVSFFYPHTARGARKLTIHPQSHEKLGPPPSQSAGAGAMKRSLFSRIFRGSSITASPPPPNRLHRRHSISGPRR